jgi:class 3 adenylate cyclase/tetratricopeptide (TPR) repeat protein
MNNLYSYLPQDRRSAITRGESLPIHCQGTALFADISGFTSLTEIIARELGPRRGIEELTRQINAVYHALITEIERFDGSVISFAGDSITCWFDGDKTAQRAVTSALALQTAMTSFPNLGLKVAMTSGPARRFIVGDPSIQVFDALVGATISRLSVAEHIAISSEVVTDEITAEALSGIAVVKVWRVTENGERFALIEGILAAAEPTPVNLPLSLETVSLRPWVLSAIFEREQSGHGVFLTELRPATALFLQFNGIEYDDDERAGEKLNVFIAHVQNILTRHEGILLQLSFGDKGSYLYAGFGALIAHEDDVRRSVQAALELMQSSQEFPFLQSIQIGISSGIMRTGAYGGLTRRTYGILGDEVNVAARLMAAAAPGEILVSGQVHQKVANLFTFGPSLPLRLKGKAEPLSTFKVIGHYHKHAISLEETHYALPMIGRQAELSLITEKLELAGQGQGQVIGLSAEAGMGKSRLVAEGIKLAHQLGFTVYGGTCKSSGTNTPYLVWKTIWQAFFDIDPGDSLDGQMSQVKSVIENRAPSRLSAIPVLSILLDIAIEDSNFTRALEPKDRRNLLTALLEDCLKSTPTPLLIVLEDMHWIDAISMELLETLARIASNLPVCFILVHRPLTTTSLYDGIKRIESLPYFTQLILDRLTVPEAGQLVQLKLAQLFPSQRNLPPQTLIAQLIARTDSNPFYMEELLNYLHDRGINPYEQNLNTLELPSSLHTLILSRIDRLTDMQNITIKTASIIGRLFSLTWLQGYYPALGEMDRIKIDLTNLVNLDLASMEAPEPELTYLFKHVIIHEVVYESLDSVTKAHLHELLAKFIESLSPDRYLDLLAFHYAHSNNIEKQREYLLKAGEAAQAAFANQAALDYYARLLPILEDAHAQMGLRLKRGAVLELLGQWPEAEAEYHAALLMSGQLADKNSTAYCQRALGTLFRMRGDYASAQSWLVQAQDTFTGLDDRAGLALTLIELGILSQRQGDYPVARQTLENALTLAQDRTAQAITAKALNHLAIIAYSEGDNENALALSERSLALKRQIGDKRGIAASLNLLGIITWSKADYTAARTFHEEGLSLFREMGDKWGISSSLNNLGLVFLDQGDVTTARALSEESLGLFRELGDKWGITLAVINLGNLMIEQGDSGARARYAEGLMLSKELGDKKNVVNSLSGLGAVAAQHNDWMRATKLVAAAETLRLSIGAVWEATEGRIYEKTLAAARAGLGEATFQSAWLDGSQLPLDEAIAYALAN